ncbi:hypothetical protein HZY83_01340, partial [Gemella sp. GH3]|uniref:hypothetical protein n=1 Tax=unclassified Gemella TaxID=2624949 RepID=UPI0015D0B1D0
MKKHILQINIHNMLFFIAYALVLVVGIVNSSTIQEYIKFGSNIRLVLIILSFILIIIKMNYIHS